MTPWNRKTLLIVTGSSQGIGKNLALEMSKLIGNDSCIGLISRSKDGLEKTKNEILRWASENKRTLYVEILSHDLSTPDLNTMGDFVNVCDRGKFDWHVLINNAGSEGSGIMSKDMSDLSYWNEYMSLNLFSVTMLTSVFLEKFKCGDRTIINITSIAAVTPIKGMGHYSIGKAARESYFNTLALENEDLQVLSYSPGPVDTKMISRLIDKLKDETTLKMFKEMRNSRTLVTIDETTKRLINILSVGNFKSGDRIDYFDPQE